MIYPKCEQRRHDCFSCDETGHCHCLNDTKFYRQDGKKYKCPFYKARTDVDMNLVKEAEDESDKIA